MTKTFVLVRRDLGQKQRAVQACHALAELVFDYAADP